MKKTIATLAALSFAIGAATECANFTGRWSDVQCEHFGLFERFEHTYPFIDIKQNSCTDLDFGGGEAVSELNKPLKIMDIPEELQGVGSIEATWLEPSQETMQTKIQVSSKIPAEGQIEQNRVAQYKIVDGKLIMDITRTDSGHRWQSLSGARCVFSRVEK